MNLHYFYPDVKGHKQKKVLETPLPIQIMIGSLLIFILLVSNSCQKEALDRSPNTYQDSTLLTFVKTNDVTIQELTYIEKGKVYELVEAYSYKKYSYNEQGNLIKLEQAMSINPLSCFMPTGATAEAGADPRKAKISQYYSFEYDNTGKLTKKSNFYFKSDAFQLISYQTYEYEGANISKLKMYNPLDVLMQYHTYAYDNNGNVNRDDYYVVNQGNDKLVYANIYEFDDKINPFKVFAAEGTPGLYTNPNNIIKDTYIYYSSQGQNQHITEYVYEYNLWGYPTKINGQDYFYGE